jgi:non-homologous end joining protein Ku
MSHGDACPYNIHYYQLEGKERVEGVLYDFDQYTMQSIEKRKADPSKPMGQQNFNDLMRGLKKSKESKSKDSKERREPEPEKEDTKRLKLSNDAGN